MPSDPPISVLVVDDSDTVRRLVRQVLHGAGFGVREAATGSDALRLAADHPGHPDLIILDVRLPDIDGFEVCRRLKVDPATASVPVLLLSGVYREVADRIRGLETGADGYLTKPFESAELVATVRALLRLRRAEAALRQSEVRRRAAEAVTEVGNILSQSLDHERVGQRIVDSLRTLLRTRASALYRLEPHSGDLVSMAASGEVGPAFGNVVLPRGTGLAGLALREGQPVASPNVLTDPRIVLTPEARAGLEHATFRAALAVPLRVADRLIGALAVGDLEGRTFDAEDIRLAQAFAGHAGLALENARLYRDVKDARDFLQSILENSPDAILTTDVHGRITYFSPGAEQMFGYRSPDVLGRAVADFYPAGRAEARALMERLRVEAQIRNYETAFRAQDGRWVEINTSVSLLRDAAGTINGTLGIIKDMTERKRAEAARAASETLLRTIIDTEPECVTLVAANATLLDMNRAGLAMIEADSLDEVLGKPVDPLVVPEYRSAFRALLERVFRGESGELAFQIIGIKGTRRWLESHAVPLRDRAGEIAALLAITRDISERKRAEEALRRSEEQLRQSQKMEAIGRLAGGVAHDFNNLLSVITGRTGILLHRMASDDPSRRHVELIEKTADRAASLTHQLLAFSRKQVLQPTILDLNAVVAGMEKMLRRLIGEDIQLVTVPGPSLGRVRADRVQLEQVLLNLAVNARDAMPEGGRLILETANAELDEVFVRHHPGARTGAYVMLAVSDTGVGMGAETQAHLFEPFFSTKGPGKGTGLGLATVYGIVKQSDGYISVYSEPKQGTAFKIYLPRVEAVAADLGASREVAGPPRGSETLLLVEDEDSVRDAAREILQLLGYTVLEARHPGEALLIGERHPGPIQLLVTDVVMPQMSGFELATRLGNLRPDMKVLYVSGYPANAIDQRGVFDVRGAFLPKPFTLDALARKVRESLDG